MHLKTLRLRESRALKKVNECSKKKCTAPTRKGKGKAFDKCSFGNCIQRLDDYIKCSDMKCKRERKKRKTALANLMYAYKA